MSIISKKSSKKYFNISVVVSLNGAAALDVKLTFYPFPLTLRNHFTDDFPLEIPVIDKNNLFRMDISGFGFREQTFGKDSVNQWL